MMCHIAARRGLLFRWFSKSSANAWVQVQSRSMTPTISDSTGALGLLVEYAKQIFTCLFSCARFCVEISVIMQSNIITKENLLIIGTIHVCLLFIMGTFMKAMTTKTVKKDGA